MDIPLSTTSTVVFDVILEEPDDLGRHVEWLCTIR